MVETEIVGDPDLRHRRCHTPGLDSRRQQADLGIGRGQDDDVTRRLAKVDRLI